MAIMMPAPDQAVLGRRDAIVAALRAIVPGEGVIDSPAEMAPLRVRRPDGLSPAADGGGAAGHHRTGVAGSEILLRAGHQGGAARLRHLAVRRRAAARRWRAAGPRQIQAHPRDRFRQPRGRDRARRDQSRHQPGGRPCRILLCARPVVADRLLDRRQCRGKFRRRALPEIRHDHQQRAGLRNRADHGRNHQGRRQVRRDLRLRPDGHHHRLRGPARRHHRGHGADPAEAGDGARPDGRLRGSRGGRRMRGADHRRRHHSGRHGDDGQAGDPRRRSLRPCRLSARRRGAADHRTRWSRRRGR